MDFSGSRFEFYENENGFITNRFNPYIKFSLEDANKELEVVWRNLSRCEKKFLFLLDFTGMMEMEKAARSLKLTATQRNQVQAIAFVGSTFISKMIINFITTHHSGDFPCRGFDTKEEAGSWLLDLMKESKFPIAS